MRVPVLPTLIVAAACAAMIGLGLWQLDRRAEKATLLALYARNMQEGPVAFQPHAPVPDTIMFRTASALCLQVTGWRTEAGRSIKGGSGYRWIAECSTGAEGPGLLADMGVTRDPKLKPDWAGGPVRGRITTEPSHQSLFAKIGGTREVLRPMLVAETPAPGLEASAPPSPDEVPNNHLAYAVQWFLFAGIAALIYGIALRRRMRAG
ncbi:MAG: SURF1 family protein [Chakrabartia godavariana]